MRTNYPGDHVGIINRSIRQIGKFRLKSSFITAKSVKFILLTLVVVTITLIANSWKNHQKITSIKIEGCRLTDANFILDDMMTEISKGNLVNEPNAIADFVVQYSSVKSVETTTVGPNSLVLQVIEYEPVAKAICGGDVYYVNSEGDLMPFKAIPKYADLHIIRALNSNLYNDDCYKAAKVAEILNSSEFIGLSSVITEILYNPRNSNYELRFGENQTNVVLGSLSNIPDKLRKLKNFEAFDDSRTDLATIKQIDLRWKNQVVIN